MSGKISIGGGGLSPKQIRSWLITALMVFVALNILLAIIERYIVFIMVGIVLITVGGMIYRRIRH